MIAKYYLSQSGRPICADCAEQDEIESGRPLKERVNLTNDVLKCIGCREDIPYVGQQYQSRRIPSDADWNSCLK